MSDCNAADNYWHRLGVGRLTRRRLLRGGAAVTGVAALGLAGCGSSKNNSSTKSTAPTAAASAAAATATGAATAGATSAATGSPTAAAVQTAQANLKTGGTLRGYITGTTNLDPVENTTYRSQYLSGFHYARLLRFAAAADPQVSLSKNVVPDLIEKYELSPDALQYAMHLRQGVTFHPPLNRPITSADIMASWDYFGSSPKNANSGVYKAIVDSLTAPDDKTLVFKLKQPFAPFLNRLANAQYLWIMSKDAVDRKIDPAQQAVGTGPFIYQGSTPTSFTWKKNPNYYVKGIPYVDAAELNIIPDISTQEAQFQAGNIDIYERTAAADSDDIKKAVPKANVVNYSPTGLAFLFFYNVQAADSPFKDPRVRQAAALAIDRQGLIDAIYNGKGFWCNLVPAGLGKWYLDPRGKDIGDAGKWFKHDPQQAKQLLTAAGHANTEFKFIYPNNAYGDVFNAAADAARGMLADAGFKLQVVPVDYLKDWIDPTKGYWAKGALPQNAIGHALQTGFTDPDDYLNGMLTKDGNRNHDQLDDPALLALVRKQQLELDTDKRLQLVYDVTRAANAKAYYPPLTFTNYYNFTQPWLQNYLVADSYNFASEAWAYASISK